MKMRLATNAEILARYPAGWRVSFDAYVCDVYGPRTETGVRRVGRGSSKVREIDGIPHVRRYGLSNPGHSGHRIRSKPATESGGFCEVAKR